MKKHRKKRSLIICGSALLLLALLCAAAFNSTLKTARYSVKTDKLTAPVKLAVIADLHSYSYGENQQQLMAALDRQQPNLVLFTGDIFDDHVPHEGAKILMKAASSKYPCFYVAGNHEFWSGEIEEIKRTVRDCGAVVLEGGFETVVADSQKITVCGVDDPTYLSAEAFNEQLKAASEGARSGFYTVLLSHRPELAETYAGFGFDLVLCCHAHGGQWRLPGIINGLYAPDQGCFPKYAGGKYQLQSTVMVVSRGLAKSRIPRIFNRPELVIIGLDAISA